MIYFYTASFYKQKILSYYTSPYYSVPDTEFTWNRPHRQLVFNIHCFRAKIHLNFSTGALVNKAIKRPKYFKRDVSNISAILILMWFFYKEIFEEPIHIYITNYSRATQIFLWRWLKAFAVNIVAIWVAKAYNPICKTRRRIKKRVFKILTKY